MELLHLLYKAAGKPAKYILLLSLGERGGKICGLVTTAVNDHERAYILKESQHLTGLSLEKKLEWLRTHCPHAYRTGYREIHKANVVIGSTHPIK